MADSRRAAVHLPWTAAIIPLMLFVCITPLATAGGAWIALYAIPALALIVVVFAGTTATARSLRARWITGVRSLRWDELEHLEFPEARWAVAVGRDGSRMVLPGVRPADLPRIVAAAGGRLFLQRPVTGQPEGTRPPEDRTSPDATAPTASPDAVTVTPDPAVSPDSVTTASG